MKKSFLFILALSISFVAFAQHSYVGIQNSTRKSMVSAMMNPAEINNFDRKVEVNFVGINALFVNNILTFSDLTSLDENLLEDLMSKANTQVNGDTHGSVMVPSFGLNLGKWSIGWANQFNSRLVLHQVNPDLGNSIVKSGSLTDGQVFVLNNPLNQRANGVMWFESGIIVGRELINNANSKLSVGTNLKLLVPVNYTNIGVSQLSGTLTIQNGVASLTNASGNMNLTYNRDIIDARNFRIDYSNIEITKPSSVGLDLGVNYQVKKDGKVWINSGVSVTNIGNLKFGASNVSNNLSIDIPAGSSFQIDRLDPDLDSTLEQLTQSGFFTIEETQKNIQVGLPTTFSLYSEIKLSEQFFVSAFWQQMIKDQDENNQVPFINVFAITPSMVLGKFEVFSPWGYFQISELTGGLGFRYGGFFVSSQTVLTSLLANRGTADIQLGLNWGFGQRRQ